MGFFGFDEFKLAGFDPSFGAGVESVLMSFSTACLAGTISAAPGVGVVATAELSLLAGLAFVDVSFLVKVVFGSDR